MTMTSRPVMCFGVSLCSGLYLC